MKKKHFIMILLFVCMLVSAFGWSVELKRERELERKLAIEAEAAGNHILNLQLDAEISTLDPQAAVDSASFEVIGTMMEGLYSAGADGTPCAAMVESMSVSEDGKSYRFVLRDAVWSNGEKVTAEDFVYGWRRGIDPANGNENAFLFQTAGIKNAEAILSGSMAPEQLGIHAADERTLEVELEQPVPYFVSMLSLPLFFPMNREFTEGCIRQYGQYGISPETLLSNGAFVMEGYQPSAQEIELKKNPSYFNASEVRLEGLHYQVIKDSQLAMMSYENGELDMALLSGEQAEQYQNSPDYRSLPLGSLWYLSPNLKTAGLENEKLRLALALAYDKETAVSQVMRDGSRAAYGAVPSGSMYGPDGSDFRDGAASYLQTDKEQAKRYLEQAKEELGRETFSFTLLTEDTEAAKNLGQFLQAEIMETLPGVTIELEPVPKKMRLERMSQGDYELGLTRWGADYSDPLAFLDMWTTGSSFNFGSWSDAEYDRLIQSARSGRLALEPEERWQAFHDAEAIVMEQAAILPVCEKANGMLLRTCVKGAHFHTIGVNRVWKDAWKEQQKSW